MTVRKEAEKILGAAMTMMARRDCGEAESERGGGGESCLGWGNRVCARGMVRAGQRDRISPEIRRHDIEQRGLMSKNAPTNTAAHIDEDVHEAPTRDHGRLNIANAATATENLAIAPEAVRPKSDDAIAVETDPQDLLMTITRENQQQEANHRLLQNTEPLDLHRPTNPATQTQTTL